MTATKFEIVCEFDGREEVLDTQATREDAEQRLEIEQAKLASGRLDADRVFIREQ